MLRWNHIGTGSIAASTNDVSSPFERGVDQVEARKAEHLRVTASRDVETRNGAGWADIRLVHEALPEIDLLTVDVSAEFLGKPLGAPLVVSSMTGGHRLAGDVNKVLARAAERHGLAMGVGSQRAALANPSLADTYAAARQCAPNVTLIGNIGVAQLIDQASGPRLDIAQARAAVRMIEADALAVHLNFLEESIQPEGDRRAHGCEAALREVVAGVGVPVIAKETGAGIARSTALRLRDIGVAALDVGGLGGTSFAAVEGVRAEAQGDARGQRLGELLRDWGLPTAVSVLGARASGLPIIATGGVRSGVDAAKALAIGADLVGVARPLLQAALQGDEAVDRWIDQFIEELRVVMFLTGSATVAELRQKPRLLFGETRTWVEQLGYETH
jgi:isopentenyl-diphosphate delta-isomerase